MHPLNPEEFIADIDEMIKDWDIPPWTLMDVLQGKVTQEMRDAFAKEPKEGKKSLKQAFLELNDEVNNDHS